MGKLHLICHIVFNLCLFSLCHSKKDKGETSSSYLQPFNTSDFFSIWDTSNIPEDILNTSQNIEEILAVMATRKYRSCKASVLYHPLKKIYYFRNPSVPKAGRGSGSMKEYMSYRCKSFPSRSISLRQRFLISFKDIEQLLDHNEDSILLEGVHEITDIRNGLEMTLFPVKFYKSLQEASYTDPKDMLCYDSLKVLGIDKNNFDYLIISALDKHKILYCDSNDLNKKHNLNNFIRYSSYCDEFCAEDFIYFSNDLIRCKCDFFSYVEDLKKNKNFITKNNDTDGCYYSRRLDRYEIFANPYEIAEKITKYEGQNKTFYRYYLHLVIVLFTFQILYAFYFTTKNSLFIKFTIIFYIILSVIVYVPHRLTSQIDVVKLCEVISDLYPVLLLVFISCDVNTKQYDILKLSFLIFINSFDYILKETHINEIELILRLIFIISSFVLGNNLEQFSGGYLQFYNVNIRIKNVFEFISRFFLYLAERGRFADLSVPLFVVMGRPREGHITSEHLLFQANYLKLKPNFDKLYENWFMEALNFHKFKNMILFLKFVRYFLMLFILSFLNVFTEINKIFSNFLMLKFNRIFTLCLSLSYKNLLNVNFGNSSHINYLHIPILISLLFTNVILTKDCLKILGIHFAVGVVIIFLSDGFSLSKNGININRRHIRRSYSNDNLINIPENNIEIPPQHEIINGVAG